MSRGATKQYCAEPEHDSYEYWYRRKEVYYDYMDEAPCKIPKTEEHFDDPIDLAETIDTIDLPAHRLTGKVRCQYLNYIENLLIGNYDAWMKTVDSYDNVTFTPDEVKRCAESIELKAVKSCMIVSLYRNCILKVISQIRKETKDSCLHPCLINMKFTPKIIKKEVCSVGVQTDVLEKQQLVPMPTAAHNDELPLLDVPAMSLDEKIRNFEEIMHIPDPVLLHKKCRKQLPKKEKGTVRNKSSRKDRTSKRKPKVSNEKSCSNETSFVSIPSKQCTITAKTGNSAIEDDQIMRELKAMFDTGDDENIFESCENQVQINAIINEIEKFDPSKAGERLDSSTASHQSEVHQLSPKFNFSSLDNSTHCTVSESTLQNMDQSKDDLKKSIWPCEFHMQKIKLREILSNIADVNYLRYERIRAKFIVLFGEYEQEEDELGPYSPSIELNEILIASCRQRIARWVVQALMKPLNDGLIGNRFLFKKLAKHIADGIIYQNQYPDQRFIKNYIVDYFCTHQAVLSAEDLN
ncbi:uncharacterized protein LOC131683474 [Topomyia yanbarensis]|uniref:uncharacterized protein LOC131683474 n=1 Tax=Topomyia yanbarensis TaxID=2498891 RepID=UPI00273BFA4B|nr:uncharacterized protein LOC131683474 [Topomyia yanbarensis]